MQMRNVGQVLNLSQPTGRLRTCPTNHLGEFMNRRLFVLLFFSLAIFAVNLTATAQTKLGPKDDAKLPASDLNRIKIGEAAPDFTLENEDGKPVSLSDYSGKKTVVLVFYRGYW